MKKISFHAFAHPCVTEKGHQFIYHRSCQQAIESLNIPYYAYIPKNHELPFVPHNWIPHFPKPYDKSVKKEYLTSCMQLFGAPSNDQRIFFIETLRRRDMRYFSLAALRKGKKTDQLWMLFRDDNLLSLHRDRLEVKIFLKLLGAKYRTNLKLFSDTDLLARYFQEQLQLPFLVTPIPHLDLEPMESNHKNLSFGFSSSNSEEFAQQILGFADEGNDQRPFPNQQHTRNAINIPEDKAVNPKIQVKKLVCLFPGEPRREKGNAVVKRLLELNDPAKMKTRLMLSEIMTSLNVQGGIDIEYFPNTLAREHYIAVIQKADIVLFPYEAEKYRYRSSGILVEAVGCGKMPLVPDGTWMASELRKFNLEDLIVDFSTPLLFTKMWKLYHNEELRAKLKEMEKAYLAFHSTEAFARMAQEILV
ncbi:MAG: hypothetical protein ACKVOH_03970 [Chlamydiales bacterium]